MQSLINQSINKSKFKYESQYQYDFALGGLLARLGGPWEQLTTYSQALSRPWEQLPTSTT